MKRVTQFILLCALVLACVLPAMAATYYVDGTNGKATPTAGTSWSDAYKDIRTLLTKRKVLARRPRRQTQFLLRLALMI